MPVLIVESGPEKGRVIALEEDRLYTVGRDERADLRLDDELVSRVHAKIRGKGGRFFLKDAGSKNGTVINDRRVENTAELTTGDRIQIGESLLSFLEKAETGAAGRQLGGYRLLQRLGRGGMGTVHRALQLSLNREVALKILSLELARDPSFVERFLKEARAAAQLNHPNIVQVFDVERDGGLIFYSMEFMAGGTVEDLILKQGPLPLDDCLTIVLDAARGLQYAEMKKIVHRDLKPGNLMRTELGATKLADLGLAHGANDEVVAKGMILGTPHFLSPEQARNQPLDTRSDLYSLGATFFRMLTGRTVFHGESAAEIVKKQVKDPPPPVRDFRPEVPEAVGAIVGRLLEKDPANRYQTVAALIEDLERAQQARPAARRRVLLPLGLLLAGGAAAAFFLLRDGRRDHGRDEPPAPVVRGNGEDSERTEQIQRALQQKERELAAMTAFTELSARLDALDAAERERLLRALADAHPGTEAGGRALDRAEQMRADREAAAAAAAAHAAAVATAREALESRAREALAEKRYADLLKLGENPETLPEPLREDPEIVALLLDLHARADAAVARDTETTVAAALEALAAGDFATARSRLGPLDAAIENAIADLPESDPRAESLARAAESLAGARAEVEAAEREKHRLALAGDLRSLRASVDWPAIAGQIRDYRFDDAATAFGLLRDQMRTDVYRDYLDGRARDAAAAQRAFEAFVQAAEQGALNDARVLHPERGVTAEITGVSKEGDGVMLEVSRGAGSARSAVRYAAFTGVEGFLELLAGRAGGTAEKLAAARGALLFAGAGVEAAARRVAEQVAHYDPQRGWTSEQALALADLVVGDPAPPRLLALLDELSADAAAGEEAQALKRRALREQEASELLRRALRPFQGDDKSGSFGGSAALLRQIVADYRETTTFLFAYPLFDGGRQELPLAGP